MRRIGGVLWIQAEATASSKMRSWTVTKVMQTRSISQTTAAEISSCWNCLRRRAERSPELRIRRRVVPSTELPSRIIRKGGSRSIATLLLYRKR